MVQRTELGVSLGDKAIPLGKVTYLQDGPRAFTQFAYAPSWLDSPQAFAVSPELTLLPGTHIHKPESREDACFFHALADTAPGHWGRQILERAHTVARETMGDLPALTPVDELLVVNDACRLGALRLQAPPLTWWPALTQPTALATLADLPRALAACWAQEKGSGFRSDIDFLMAHGVSLGGSRPKISLLDEDGTLALAKFPRLGEPHNVPLGEVLALKMASMVGIGTAQARIEHVDQQTAVAIVRRFDRGQTGGRKHSISAAALLQANHRDQLSYLELLQAMKRVSPDFVSDAQQLWRRLAFNLLITNTDDHLRNTALLYAGPKRWRLAPAFDLNPRPNQPRASITALSRKSGPVTNVRMLLEHAPAFELSSAQAKAVLAEVVTVVKDWREIARSEQLILRPSDVAWYASAFEHEQVDLAVHQSR